MLHSLVFELFVSVTMC